MIVGIRLRTTLLILRLSTVHLWWRVDIYPIKMHSQIPATRLVWRLSFIGSTAIATSCAPALTEAVSCVVIAKIPKAKAELETKRSNISMALTNVKEVEQQNELTLALARQIEAEV